MLHVITPSRGRPANAMRLRQALRETCAGEHHLWLGVDDDDPELHAYLHLRAPETTVVHGPRNHLTGWTNHLAATAMDHGAAWLASLGDDHVPRTMGWDKTLIDAIEAMPGPGWAYGDDLLQGQELPTAWAQSAELVTALGWMMLPSCQHLMVDVVVRELGRETGRLAYLADVVVEHMHSANGKALDDDTYRHGNSAMRVRDDSRAYAAWRNGPRFADDCAAVEQFAWEIEHG